MSLNKTTRIFLRKREVPRVGDCVRTMNHGEMRIAEMVRPTVNGCFLIELEDGARWIVRQAPLQTSAWQGIARVGSKCAKESCIAA